MTMSAQKDFLETREIKEIENSKSQSPDLNYILRVHSGANLIRTISKLNQLFIFNLIF